MLQGAGHLARYIVRAASACVDTGLRRVGLTRPKAQHEQAQHVDELAPIRTRIYYSFFEKKNLVYPPSDI